MKYETRMTLEAISVAVQGIGILVLCYFGFAILVGLFIRIVRIVAGY